MPPRFAVRADVQMAFREEGIGAIANRMQQVLQRIQREAGRVSQRTTQTRTSAAVTEFQSQTTEAVGAGRLSPRQATRLQAELEVAFRELRTTIETLRRQAQRARAETRRVAPTATQARLPAGWSPATETPAQRRAREAGGALVGPEAPRRAQAERRVAESASRLAELTDDATTATRRLAAQMRRTNEALSEEERAARIAADQAARAAPGATRRGRRGAPREAAAEAQATAAAAQDAEATRREATAKVASAQATTTAAQAERDLTTAAQRASRAKLLQATETTEAARAEDQLTDAVRRANRQLRDAAQSRRSREFATRPTGGQTVTPAPRREPRLEDQVSDARGGANRRARLAAALAADERYVNATIRAARARQSLATQVGQANARDTDYIRDTAAAAAARRRLASRATAINAADDDYIRDTVALARARAKVTLRTEQARQTPEDVAVEGDIGRARRQRRSAVRERDIGDPEEMDRQAQDATQRLRQQNEILARQNRTQEAINQTAERTYQRRRLNARVQQRLNEHDARAAEIARLDAQNRQTDADRRRRADIAEDRRRTGRAPTFFGAAMAASRSVPGRPPPNPYDVPGFGQFMGGRFFQAASWAIPGLGIRSIFQNVSDLIRETEQLEVILEQIRAQFRAMGEEAAFTGFRDSILRIARDTGLAADEVAYLGFQLRGVGAALPGPGTPTEKALREMEAAAKAAVVTGLPLPEIIDSLTAASLAFGVSIETLTGKAIGLEERFGVLSKESMKFFGDFSNVAEQYGFTFEEASAALGLLQRNLGLSSTAIAEAMGRILPAVQQNFADIIELFGRVPALQGQLVAVQEAFATGDTERVVRELSAAWGELGPGIQASVVSMLGGRREARYIIPMMQQYASVLEDEVAAGADDAAKANERFQARVETVSQTMERLRQSFRQIGTALFEAGLSDVLQNAGQAAIVILDAIRGIISLLPNWLAQTLLWVGAVRAAYGLLRGMVRFWQQIVAFQAASAATGAGGGAMAGQGVLAGMGGAAARGGMLASRLGRFAPIVGSLGMTAAVGLTIKAASDVGGLITKIDKWGEELRTKIREAIKAGDDDAKAKIYQLSQQRRTWLDRIIAVLGDAPQDIAAEEIEADVTRQRAQQNQPKFRALRRLFEELTAEGARGPEFDALSQEVRDAERALAEAETREYEDQGVRGFGMVPASEIRRRAIADAKRRVDEARRRRDEYVGKPLFEQYMPEVLGEEASWEEFANSAEFQELERKALEGDKEAFKELYRFYNQIWARLPKHLQDRLTAALPGMAQELEAEAARARGEADYQAIVADPAKEIAAAAAPVKVIQERFEAGTATYEQYMSAVRAQHKRIKDTVDRMKANGEAAAEMEAEEARLARVLVDGARTAMQAVVGRVSTFNQMRGLDPAAAIRVLRPLASLEALGYEGQLGVLDEIMGLQQQAWESQIERATTGAEQLDLLERGFALDAGVRNQFLGIFRKLHGDPAADLLARLFPTRLQATADQIKEARRRVYDEALEKIDLEIELLTTIAGARGDEVAVAQFELQQANRRYQEALRAPAGVVTANELESLRIATLQAQDQYADTLIRNQQELIDFQLEMGQITTQQAIALLQALLQQTDDIQIQRDIMRRIKALTDEANQQLQFNIGDLRLPTLYEVRRTIGTQGAGVGYQDNRQVSISIVVNGAQDMDAAVAAFTDAVNAPSRYGQRAPLAPSRYN